MPPRGADGRHVAVGAIEPQFGLDACVTPVLSMVEAVDNEHLAERGAFLAVEGVACCTGAAVLADDAPRPAATGTVHRAHAGVGGLAGLSMENSPAIHGWIVE